MVIQGELAAVELKYQALADKLSLYHSLVHLHMALPPPAVDKVDEVAREKAFFSSAIAAVKKEAALIEQGIATLGEGILARRRRRYQRLTGLILCGVDRWFKTFAREW